MGIVRDIGKDITNEELILMSKGINPYVKSMRDSIDSRIFMVMTFTLKQIFMFIPSKARFCLNFLKWTL